MNGRTARFFYFPFDGKVASRTYETSTTSPARFDGARLARLPDATQLRLAGATIERLSWQDCMARYDREHTLFFVDPPYYGLAGYGVKFGAEHYEQLTGGMAHAKARSS